MLYHSLFVFQFTAHHRDLHSFPTRRSSDLIRRIVAGAGHLRGEKRAKFGHVDEAVVVLVPFVEAAAEARGHFVLRSEEHTSELQSRQYLVCRLLLEKKKKTNSRS